MRNAIKIGSAGLCVLAATSACKWTEFDELEDEAWVSATEKPANDSANWGIAIQRASLLGSDGGRLAVLGASEPLFNELAYGAAGAVSVESELELGGIGIVALDAQPFVLADPVSDDVAVMSKSGSASIAVVRVTAGTPVVHQVFGPDRIDAATYMLPPVIGGTTPAPSQTLVARDDLVFGTFFGGPPNPQPSCKLIDGAGAPVLVRALGAVRTTAGTDDVIVWSSTGAVLTYPGAVFNGVSSLPACTGAGVPPLATSAMTTMLAPAAGSRILTFETTDGGGVVDGRYAILAGGNDANEGVIQLVDLATLTFVGGPRTDQRLEIAELLTLGAQRFVVAGYPTEILDGVTSGVVRVFEVKPTGAEAGIGAAPALVLHDAQPEDNQSFGRGLAVMPHNGQPTIAVAGDNEVWVYYRTSLYGDTRTGR